MPKLAKNYYYNSKGEKKLNCYILHIPKDLLARSGISEEEEIKINVEDKKIVVERCNNEQSRLSAENS